MASVNPHTRELVFKLVFYGPGLGGKTTTLQYIHAATKAEYRGKMVSLATPTDRTLYFDFLPIRIARIRGMAVRLQLFTVPGQVYYAATRKLVLSGADGVVFVADSQNGRMETNQEALDDLLANLAEHNRGLAEIPHTFQWNKRDLGDLVSVEELDRRFNKLNAPSLGTVATAGEGVFEGLERIVRLVLKSYDREPNVRIEASSDLRDGEAGEASEPRTPSEEEVALAVRGLEAPDPFVSSTKTSGRALGPAAADDAPGEPRPSSVKGSSAWARFTFPDPSASASPPSSAPGRPSRPIPSSVPGHLKAASTPPGSRSSDRPARSDSLRSGAGFSVAEFWPETERESVRQVEAMMAAADAVHAILACDVLVTRVLASAAGLVGTLDAPRDPAVVALLLGLDGSRYLQFRTAVRAARHREPVTMKDAFECLTLAFEARRARESLRR